MAKIGKFIRKTNMATRVVSVLLVIAILCGSFVWFGNNDMSSVSASGTTKKYAEYIIERMTKGMQDKFNILEIVPYDGFGEMRYYLNQDEVRSGLGVRLAVLKAGGDTSWCPTTQKDWAKLDGNGFGNFGYQVRFNHIYNSYEVKGNDDFLNTLFGEQAGILAERVKLNTVEANDLTAEMINSADLIVFTSSPHDEGTIKLYESWKGETGYKFYTSSGTEASEDSLYYDTYEKSGDEYISRDMNWDSFKALLTCTVKGRNISLANGTTVALKTPVIMDCSETSGLNHASNVYKFNLIYRTLCGADGINDSELATAFDKLIEYLQNNKSIELNTTSLASILSGYSYTNIVSNCFEGSRNTWLSDYFFSYRGNSLLSIEATEAPTDDKVLYFKNTAGWPSVNVYYWSDENETMIGYPGKVTTKLADGTYKAVFPKEATEVIFNYYDSSKTDVENNATKTGDLVIPTDGKNCYTYSSGSWGNYSESTTAVDYSSCTGVTVRTGSSAKLADVLQFLMGSKSSQIATYDYGHMILDIEEEEVTNWIYYSCSSGIPHAYMWGSDGYENAEWKYAPAMTKVSGDVYGIEVPYYAEYVIFKVGSSKTGDLTIQKNKRYNGSYWETYTPPSKPKVGFSKNSIKVLEVQPCNSFTYSGLDGANKLGKKLLMQGAGTWDSNGGTNDYRHYLKVTTLTTNALNGMTGDLVSEYDIIIIGEDISHFTKGDNGKTIFNDRTLNGYVYLAFGDLFKIHTNALGVLPSEYVTTTDTNYTKLNSFTENRFTQNLLNSFTYGERYVLKDMQATYKDTDFGNDGKFYSDYELGNTRGVDNDITNITKQKLIQFAKSGKTVILANSLYDCDSYSVYPTSDMMDFCGFLEEKDNGNRKYGVYSMNYMSGAVNNRVERNPQITMTVQPTPPEYENGVIKTYNENGRQINFEFEFTGKVGHTYKIKLYVDKNSDGVYKGIEEGVSDDRNELYFSRDVVYKITNRTNNTMEYKIDSQISNNFIGMLAWKIEVVELDSSGKETAYSNSVKGYSAIKNTETKVVEVLQIIPKDQRDDWDGDNATLNMGYNDPHRTDDFWDLLQDIESKVGYDVHVTVKTNEEYAALFEGSPYTPNGRYVYYVNSNNWGDPYAHYWSSSGSGTIWPGVKMEHVTGNIYATFVPYGKDKIIFSNNGASKTSNLDIKDCDEPYYNGSWSNYPAGKKRLEMPERNDHLKFYDMVVIGFADMYGASEIKGDRKSSDIDNSNGAVDNIAAFIDQGKAVLFTHDTITWRVAENYTVTNGGSGTKNLWESYNLDSNGSAISGVPYHDDACHNITVQLRDRVGLDKYGVSLAPENRDGYAKPMYPSSNMMPTYTTEGYYVEELQGFTPWFYYRNNFCSTFNSSYPSGTKGIYSLRPFPNEVISIDRFGFNREESWKTTKVSQTNEGCITQYPYLITENLTVGLTHGQYWSLNMEDEDVVVWYTLADDGVNYIDKGIRYNCGEYYGVTDKDAENNYYIYSKNNITYSGAGHSSMNSSSSVAERKLFVNTVIKAIAGGNMAPAITVTNGAVGAGEIHYVYVSEGNTASNYEMHILAKDADLVSPEAAGIDYVIRQSDLNSLKADGINVDVIGHFKTAKVYWVKNEGTTQTKVLIKEFKDNDPLHNGVIYELKLGNTTLTKQDLAKIELLVEGDGTSKPEGADFIIEVSDWLDATSEIYVKLVERELFLID